MTEKAKRVIINFYGENYIGKLVTKTKAGAQDAHEAVRPTSAKLVPSQIKSQLTPDQYKLYKLI